MRTPWPLQLLLVLALGLSISLVYGVVGALFLSIFVGNAEARQFLHLYIGPFNAFFSLGLAIGAALIVGRSKIIVFSAIESAFGADELSATTYFPAKARFLSRRRAILAVMELAAVAFVIFTFSNFPLSDVAEGLMLLAACAQWALLGYIARKLTYALTMLHAVEFVPVNRNVFRRRELDPVRLYVSMTTTLGVVFVYSYVRGYLNAPFRYGSVIGPAAQVFVMLPVVLAAVLFLVLNVYARDVLRVIYTEAITIEILQMHSVRPQDRIDILERGLREELRDALRPGLSDIPIGTAALLILIETYVNR